MLSETVEQIESQGGKLIPFEHAIEHIKQNGTDKLGFGGSDGSSEDDLPIGWTDPQPLPDGLRTVPALPEELIPSSLRPWLTDISDRLQVPLEFPTIAAIVCLASIIGNQIRIRPKRRDDWLVVPNLWGAIIGRPGVMKTPAISEPMKPLHRLVKEAEARHKEDLSDWRFEKESADVKRAAMRDEMKKAAKAGRDLDEFRDKMGEDELPTPTERRYVVNDTTVEKYGELLNQNPHGLLLFRDELTGWLRSLDDERRANDKAFYLEAWNGDGSYSYDRIGRGTLKISNTTTSILGGIQPGLLEPYLRNALGYGTGDDGLIQRFQLAVYPDIDSDWKHVDRWPDSEAKNQAYEIYKELSEINSKDIGAEYDDEGRAFLRFDDDAQELFNEWFINLNKDLRAGEFEHPALESHFSKYRSLLPSLALIFHLADLVTGSRRSSIGLRDTEMAAAWCEFLSDHALRIYGLGIGAAAIHARTLAQHLQKGDLENPFTAREIAHKGWAGLSRAGDLTDPLDLLEGLGWLWAQDVRTSPRGGRPTVHYHINPKIQGVKL